MEVASTENSQPSTVSNEVEHPSDEAEPQLLDHGDEEMKTEITEEELRGILEAIAATGKFWHDWDTLKGLLFFRLKQVLAEYPESQMDDNQQSTSLGETYSELVRRLEEALFSFIEGPPFTLQRLCEILLAARSLYPKLSKLAFALEKILLVTSTLTISTASYTSTAVQKLDESEKGSVELLAHSSPLQNGVRPVVGDLDEEMADAEEIPLDNKDEEIAVADKEPEIAEDSKVDVIVADNTANVTASDSTADVMAADTTADVMAADTADNVMAADTTSDVMAADNTADVMAADSKIDEVGADKKDGVEDAADHKDGVEDAANHKDGDEDAADHKVAEKEIAEEAVTGASDASSDKNIKAGPSGTPPSPSSEHLHSTS